MNVFLGVNIYLHKLSESLLAFLELLRKATISDKCLKAHTETTIFIALNWSIFALCFLSIILFWLKIKFLRPERYPNLCLIKMSITPSVRLFCDKFIIWAFPNAGSIFYTPLSVSLFRMNLIVLAFEYFTNSQICIIVWSPTSALVKSIVSTVLL